MPSDETLANTLSDRFNQALAYAATLHRAQSRKGTQIPYVPHLLGVAGLVLEHGGTEDEAIAALLHDAIEDQGGPATGETIRALFGDAVHAMSVRDNVTSQALADEEDKGLRQPAASHAGRPRSAQAPRRSRAPAPRPSHPRRTANGRLLPAPPFLQ
jgi:(p)ppGpp synthase/HD superfamily hydrolase